MEIAHSEELKTILCQSIVLQTYIPPHEKNVKEIIKWGAEFLSQNSYLPVLGIIADVGHLVQGLEPGKKEYLHECCSIYEDQVLGRIHSNYMFAECSEIIKSHKDRNLAKGIVFILEKIFFKLNVDNLEFSPSVLNTMMLDKPEDIIAHGKESIAREGIHPYLVSYYESLISSFRGVGDFLKPEDLLEVQTGVFLDNDGDKLALRQVFAAASILAKMLPRNFAKPMSNVKETPTCIFEENVYPIGGFSSITTRGSVENILHSQLIYIEEEEDPDMFTIKFLRDELLYYSRDENQFLRKRRNFVFIFSSNLYDAINFKDSSLSYQRSIFLLGFFFVTIKRILDELSNDALKFHFIFEVNQEFLMQKEFAILSRIFREQIINDTIDFYLHAEKSLENYKDKIKFIDNLEVFCKKIAEKSICHVINISTKPEKVEGKTFHSNNLLFQNELPKIKGFESFNDDLLEKWADLLKFFIVKLIY